MERMHTKVLNKYPSQFIVHQKSHQYSWTTLWVALSKLRTINVCRVNCMFPRNPNFVQCWFSIGKTVWLSKMHVIWCVNLRNYESTSNQPQPHCVCVYFSFIGETFMHEKIETTFYETYRREKNSTNNPCNPVVCEKFSRLAVIKLIKVYIYNGK